MDIKTAIEKAIEGGYQELFWDGCKECGGVGRDDNIDFVCTVCKGTGNGDLLLEEMSAQWERFTSDPLFWQSLYGSEKYGRIKALEFINAIFDGKLPEDFFEQEPDLGEEQQEKTLS